MEKCPFHPKGQGLYTDGEHKLKFPACGIVLVEQCTASHYNGGEMKFSLGGER